MADPHKETEKVLEIERMHAELEEMRFKAVKEERLKQSEMIMERIVPHDRKQKEAEMKRHVAEARKKGGL
jgi:hypothetical protein